MLHSLGGPAAVPGNIKIRYDANRAVSCECGNPVMVSPPLPAPGIRRLVHKEALKTGTGERGGWFILNLAVIDRTTTLGKFTVFGTRAQHLDSKLVCGRLYIFSNGSLAKHQLPEPFPKQIEFREDCLVRYAMFYAPPAAVHGANASSKPNSRPVRRTCEDDAFPSTDPVITLDAIDRLPPVLRRKPTLASITAVLADVGVSRTMVTTYRKETVQRQVVLASPDFDSPVCVNFIGASTHHPVLVDSNVGKTVVLYNVSIVPASPTLLSAPTEIRLQPNERMESWWTTTGHLAFNMV